MSKATWLAVATFAVLGCNWKHSDEPVTGQTTLTSAEVPLPTPPVLPGTPDVPALVAKVSPSVVNITATHQTRLHEGPGDPFELFLRRRGGQDEVITQRALGSGFIIDDAGHVVTNAHVVANASTVSVTLSDERELVATVKGRDERLDVAVLELHGAKDLPVATLGSSEPLRVGEYVVAIGNPFGLGNTVTMGIVSAKSRSIGAGPYDDFIQTDASINPGNSGGPLFNLRGEVVGINTAINAAGKGIGFAIPIDAVRAVLPQLLEKGSVSRGRLGLAAQEIDAAIAKSLGLDRPRGALVGETLPGGPAAKAGIQPGDVVLRVDGEPIDHAHELPRLIARHTPGTKVRLEILGRDKKKRTVQATLDALPADKAERLSTTAAPARPSFGLRLEDDAAHQGAVVREIDPTSSAASLLQPTDVITSVNGQRVHDADDAAAKLHATAPGEAAVLRFRRGGHELFAAIERP